MSSPFTRIFLSFLVGIFSLCGFAFASVAQVISQSSQMIDSNGTVWTISGGVVYQNGAPAGYSSSVIMLAYANGVVYQENSSQNWWAWNGTAWVVSDNPATKSVASPNGTSIPSAQLIVDTNGGVWTVSGGVVYLNGSVAGYSTAVIKLYWDGVMYQENSAGHWWAWNGTAWVSSGEPTSTTSASPYGTSIPSASQIVDKNGAIWTVANGAVYVNATPAGYSNDVMELYWNGTIYQQNKAGNWWAWNGALWLSANSPLVTVSPNGTKIPPAAQIVDSFGAVWTLTSGVANINGAPAGSSNAVIQLLFSNGDMFQEDSAQNWQAWNGTWIGACVNSSGAVVSSTSGTCSVSRSPVVGPSPVGAPAPVVSVPVSPSPVIPLPVPPTPVAPAPVSPTPVAVGLAGTKMGVNLDWVNDWGDRALVFVDVMKIARGFAKPSAYWDPTNNPVPVDGLGWPTVDFGVMFMSNGSDPLGRPLTSTFPSMFGTYNLSFTGRATISGVGCCQVQNVNYDSAMNTTTAQVVVGPNDAQVALTFTNTNGGVQNLRLLRPGYPIGTTQVFTNQLLNELAPFSTVRFMVPLLTNNSTVTSWSQRTLPSNPTQAGPAGIAWEYIAQLGNVSGKDIWIDIPQGVDLTDPSPNNYATQLANLLKTNLKPGIHVYVEYSNEVWNSTFAQFQSNVNAAVAEVKSGADPTLDYDGSSSNQWYWSYRRTAHQVVRISQLFANVYGASAINTTIRPVLMSQFVQPNIAEDSLIYINKTFGRPNQFIYGIGGGPYFWPANSYTDMNSLFAQLQNGMNQYALPGFIPGQVYNGTPNWSLPIPTYKTLADYYGLKSVAYEGGLGLGDGTGPQPVISEQSRLDPRSNAAIQQELADWFGCGNDLFMYYSLATAPGDYYGLYEDPSLPTPGSAAVISISKTPLASYKVCSSSVNTSLLVQ